MSVLDCIERLTKSGKISAATAAQAEGLWRRYQGKFSLDMPPAQADAAAALQAAREMAASSRVKKNSVALQVKRQTSAEAAQMAHPWGPAAGGMAILTRDIYRLGGANVDTRIQTLRELFFSKFNKGIEAYQSTLAGLKQDTIGVRRMIGELFGVDSGDAVAKAAAKGWQDATEAAVKYVQSAGKMFEENENWRLPQFWNADRVRRFGMGSEFVRDVMDAVASKGVAVWDKERNLWATAPDRIKALVEKASRDIITEAGAAPVFSKEMRTFHFADGKSGFDAFMKLQDKYGQGTDILSTLTGHLSSMAREGALVDMLGPQHRATVAMLEKNARAWERSGGPKGVRAARVLGMESSGAIARTYKVLNGEANGVESQFWGGLMGSARSIMSASALGSAVVPATIGDSVTAVLAARYNGMEPGKVLARTLEVLTHENPHLKEDAARLLVTGHMMSDHAISTLRYPDQLATPELLRKVSDFVIRASGLTHWTEGIKKAFTLEFLSFVARNAGTEFAKLDEPFSKFLTRYGIDAAEWDALRGRKLFDFQGAKFFDTSQAATDESVRKIYEGILQERAMAVLEPDARIRGVTSQGQRAGSFVGEIARSLSMFQSFSLTMIATHMHALAIKDGVAGNRALNNVLFYTMHLFAGAAIVQSRQILQGKDPIDMHNTKFWWQSAVQGGGLGYFGDLIGGVTQSADRSVTGKFSGPIGGFIDDAAMFGNQVINRQPGAGGSGVQLLKHITPGSNLWFSRLATDRLVFDQLQRLADPNYSRSFANREQRAAKQYGQGFFWRPGETTPDRAPRLTAGFGQ